MITIKEMAEILGVSTTTVSNVIHGKTSEVSKRTVERVQKLLKEYDYVPNINARNLASNRSGIIGIGIVAKQGIRNYLEDAFIAELVGTIERELKSYGYYLMMYFAESVQEMIRTIFSWNADGMIMLGMNKEEYGIVRGKYRKPYVFIDCYLDNIQVDGVMINLDDRRGGYLMGQYLIEQGHRKILFLADNFEGGDYERYYGFAAAMSEAGCVVGKGNFFRLHADEQALLKSLEQVAAIAKRYTAIFCASDYYALRTLNFLRDKGIRVPEDISIAGFDDNQYSRLARPEITTIHQSAAEKGVQAVRSIMGQLKGNPIKNNWIVLPVSLVERGSVRKII